MTMPHQEADALRWTEELLVALIDYKKTPRVPETVREWAGRCLHHYPVPMRIECLFVAERELKRLRESEESRRAKE